MRKRILLHIGIGKTGTSAIQLAFSANPDYLNAIGVLYPKSGRVGLSHGHQMLSPHDSRDGLSAESLQAWSAAIDEIRESSASRAVISAEQFSYCGPTVVEHIQALLREFEVTIIMYVRHQTDLIGSTYLQKIKMIPGFGLEPLEFALLNFSSFLYTKRIAPWTASFGDDRLSVRVYDRRLLGGDVVHDFCASNEIAESGFIVQKPTVNASLSAALAPVLRLYDAIVSPSDARRKLVAALIDASPEIPQVAVISKEVRAALRSMYASDNEVFAGQYLTKVQADVFLNPKL